MPGKLGLIKQWIKSELKRAVVDRYGRAIGWLETILYPTNLLVRSLLLVTVGLSPVRAAEIHPVLQEFCLDCHGNDVAEAHVNFEKMSGASIGKSFKDWERAARMLKQDRMPPPEMPQPSGAQREQVVQSITSRVNNYIQRHAGDPGEIIVRRLTSAEYRYTVNDLTGVDLRFGASFVSDAVGGEGFTNVGGAQFMQDSTMERYLEAAKTVASHAIIGAGPLGFFQDPGETGRELSAIQRIQQIYRSEGFRPGAGEGAVSYGLDRYPKAFFAAWKFHYRDANDPDAKLNALANASSLSPVFLEHIYNVLTRQDHTYPLSEIVALWRALPPRSPDNETAVRQACDAIYDHLSNWHRDLASNAGDPEEAPVFWRQQAVAQPSRQLSGDVHLSPYATSATLLLSVNEVAKHPQQDTVVVWRNAQIRLLDDNEDWLEEQPLKSVLAESSAERLQFGSHPIAGNLAPSEFAIHGSKTVAVTLDLPPGMIKGVLTVELELDCHHGNGRVVRCRFDQPPAEKIRLATHQPIATTVLCPKDPAILATWQAKLLGFADAMPEVSHMQPAPSDRDPIPAPFNNHYNNAERNHFHYFVKYHRDDLFFVNSVADIDLRRELDEAWIDLLTSFDYYDAYLRFLAHKYNLPVDDRSLNELSLTEVQQMPTVVGDLLTRLRQNQQTMLRQLAAAEPGHLQNALKFAARAWRRPLADHEAKRLRDFYERQRDQSDHRQAIRALIARTLVAPSFLYRVEPSDSEDEIALLSDWELASRLSYFLWSSAPDQALRTAARSQQLRTPEHLRRHVKRMLTDDKARRLATEFFGQWLGFYRFDEYGGIDPDRFPEFGATLKSAMYREAQDFFTHIIRADRPVDEIVLADYTFVNAALANHYGVEFPVHGSLDAPPDQLRTRVTNDKRGGLFGLGAVLTTTSAPLRTSAVKRGDWVLRRILGTPVPPPPADAGSIAADDVVADGSTVRQRLEIHRQSSACINCHERMDPLGFALEHYDPIGRWRDTYRDGQTIDATGTLSDGTRIEGPNGLRQYVYRERRQFHLTLCTKLLGYALGRAELASDRPLVNLMMSDIESGQGFSALVNRIVCSEQFRNRRVGNPGRDF